MMVKEELKERKNKDEKMVSFVFEVSVGW